MILLSCSFLLWSVFFFPLFPPDAMPEHSELIDGDPGLGVYWESKNSFIRNDARLYWRAGAVRVSCPVQLGGRASGMKPTSFKKSSKNGTGRSIGQAVACLVMAAAIAHWSRAQQSYELLAEEEEKQTKLIDRLDPRHKKHRRAK